MASYKRNNYKYMTGHYQKQQLTRLEAEIIPISTEIKTSGQTLEDRVEKMSKVNVSSVTNAALGSLAASTAINGAKRLFAPNTLPATKGDVDTLKKEINELKNLLKGKETN
ncbi:hypothetical protein ACGK9U_01675 [Mariniflexile sp. HNIBRBA6329]|uniref:hypothetical protein n=1 Tax=Mariniflexile sp. HNIBRBA6329 TaxID=3373088 RepID=UPI0037459698